MKKYLFVLFAVVSTVSLAQTTPGGGSSFGIKAGLNYNSNGELKEIVTAGENILENRGDGKVGYHIGFYGKLKLASFYLRPELIYTSTTSEYPVSGEKGDYKVSKLDLPVLLGYKIIGPLSIFAGPAFQYTLNNDLELSGVDISDVENEVTVGLHVGAGVQLGNLGLDVRYERGFTENEAAFIDSNATQAFTLDSRPSQLIFSLSFKL